MSTIPDLSPAAVRLELIARREIALIDLREEAEFARGHPLFASQIPLSRLELEALHGHAVRLAERHRVPAPSVFAIYAALRPYRDGAPTAPAT